MLVAGCAAGGTERGRLTGCDSPTLPLGVSIAWIKSGSADLAMVAETQPAQDEAVDNANAEAGPGGAGADPALGAAGATWEDVEGNADTRADAVTDSEEEFEEAGAAISDFQYSLDSPSWVALGAGVTADALSATQAKKLPGVPLDRSYTAEGVVASFRVLARLYVS